MTKDADYYRLNAARCKICDTTVVATKEKELHSCRCGNLTVTGNRSYGGLVRYIKQIDYYKDQYEELSQYDMGHPIAQGHAIVKPASALEEMCRGKCFIQRHLHSPLRGWRMLDEYGQSLEAVEVIVGQDYLHYVTARFRFRPVAGLNLYICGGISEKAMAFIRYIQDDIIPEFMERGQSKRVLIEILKENGFQDRTGMGNSGDEWRV